MTQPSGWFATPQAPTSPESLEKSQTASGRSNHGSATNQPKRRSGMPDFKTARRLLRYWWLEIIALLLVITAFVAIVATLCQFRDQTIPRWPADFSINALLSLYGVVFRAPMMLLVAEGIGQLKWQWLRRPRVLYDITLFDEATRGPWGSVKLLYALYRRHLTATLGTLITLFALGIDPFTQAIVSYYSCTTNSEGLASVARINSLGPEAAIAGAMSRFQASLSSSWSDASIIKAPYACTSGNCTFSEPYHTVGLCSICQNVTFQVNTTCGDNPRPKLFGQTDCLHSLPCPYCEHDLNQTTYLTVGYNAKNDNESIALENPEYTVFSAARQFHFRTSHETNRPPYDTFETKSEYGPSGGLQSNYLLSYSPAVLAAKCDMYACVQTYQAQVQAERFSETLISTSNNWSYSLGDHSNPIEDQATRTRNYNAQTVRVDCLSDQTRALLLTSSQISNSTVWMAWNGTYLNRTEAEEGIGSLTRDAIPKECVYQFSRAAYNEEVFKALNGTLRATTYTNIAADNGNRTVEPMIYEPDTLDPSLDNVFDYGLISLDTIKRAFANYSTAYTALARRIVSNPDSDIIAAAQQLVASEYPFVRIDNDPAKGVVLEPASCIHVRWAWLALPSGLTVATIVFFICMVLQATPDAEHSTWKSTPLAMLWHGLDGPVEREGAWLNTREQMEKRAKEVKVRLRTTDKGRRLVQYEERDE